MSISLCEDCVYYSYDEESDSYYCDEQLDEDEMASFLRGKLTACPFYHPGPKRLLPRGKAIKIAKREHAQACSFLLSVSIKM